MTSCIVRKLATLGALTGCVFLSATGRGFAQSSLLTGYLQTVPLGTGATSLQGGNGSLFNRVRLTTEPVLGPVSFRASYEHAFTFRRRSTTGGIVGRVPTGGEWLKLQWGASDTEHFSWTHRFDRLQVDWEPASGVQLSAGRQAVSWGTTLFLTPADPFSPFSPADPFREFRAGVDAGRVRFSPSALSEIDIVVRPSKTVVGEETTALARGLMTIKNWELSGWVGSLYGDAAGAVGFAGSVGSWAVRGETVFRNVWDETIFRGTIGVDRLFLVRGKDVIILAEYQRDELGGSTAADYLDVVRSAPFARGELQVIGRDETVFQTSLQIHPLWSVAGLWLWNLGDRSALFSPTVAYSVSDEAALAAGVLFGLGDDDVTQDRPLPSEHGLAGVTGYLSLSWFF